MPDHPAACFESPARTVKQLESASYRSRSPRFGKGSDHARCGAKAAANPPLSAERKGLGGPGAHDATRDHHGSIASIGSSYLAIT